eukprot:COSAG05_NODE_4414_length_1525_cov_1.293128_1_plen_57_part_10
MGWNRMELWGAFRGYASVLRMDYSAIIQKRYAVTGVSGQPPCLCKPVKCEFFNNGSK